MKQVNIFLGGGVALLEGDQQQCGYRPTVIDPVISKLNSRRNAKRFYVVKTYADLVTEYIPNGQQEHYNEFVREKQILLYSYLMGISVIRQKKK